LIKAVIFDLGNVLIDFDYSSAAFTMSRLSGKTRKEIINFFYSSRDVGLFEEGKISPEEFHRRLKDQLKLKLSFNDFSVIWNEVFYLTPKNRQVYSLALNLRKNYKTGLLSNTNRLHFDYLKRKFSVFDAFDVIVTSFGAKCAKPKAGIYKNVLRKLKVRPPEAFYTDDRPELIESAKGIGMNAFVFKDMQKLRSDLAGSGVDV